MMFVVYSIVVSPGKLGTIHAPIYLYLFFLSLNEEKRNEWRWKSSIDHERESDRWWSAEESSLSLSLSSFYLSTSSRHVEQRHRRRCLN